MTHSPLEPGPGEWLLTDGAGGFAMGADGGPPSRRYHAWLIAAADPPLGRTVLWRGAAEWWTPEPEGHGRGPRRFETSCHRFASAEEPVGPRPGPAGCGGGEVRWESRTPGLLVRRRLRLAAGVARMDWQLHPGGGLGGPDGPAPDAWWMRPFTPLTDFHALSRASDAAPELEPFAGGVRLRRGPVEAEVLIEAARGIVRVEPQWWHEFSLPAERARGQDSVHDAWSPLVLRVPLPEAWAEAGAGGEADPVRVSVTVRLLRPWAADPPASWSVADGSGVVTPAVTPADPPAATPAVAASRLAASGDAFVVRRGPIGGGGRTIIAGYPWFADWGRDALISLPGLLPPGRRDAEAVAVLAALAAHRRDGLLPNCFHDQAGADFHAADTGPWFLRTVAAYAATAGGVARVAEAGLLDAAADIVAAVVRGTRHGIRLDADGLLTAGEPGGPAVTWMDAVRDGVAFTPRHGKAVEVNALWIEGLRGLAEIEPDAARAGRYRELADHAAASFLERFPWPDRGCLVDRLASRDPSDPRAAIDRPVHELRPNQLIAAACPRVPLDAAARGAIVDACREHLLTPAGLRTLEPTDPAYRGRYEGDLFQRDAAYHQGTVWPWLMGPFVDAMLLAAGRDPDRRRAAARQAWQDLQPLLGSLDDGCRGFVAEVYDGDRPHRADGCPAQAWSVAELRRVLEAITPLLPDPRSATP